jgi:hypothetical protein
LSLENSLVLRCLHVPEDYRTLNEGYKRIEQIKGAVTTIVLGQGEHVVEEYTDKEGDSSDEDGDSSDEHVYHYLEIKCPLNIIGSPKVLDKSDIVVVGGFFIGENIHSNVHVEHLTIRHKEGSGVLGYSSFTLNDLMIDQCGQYGVYVYGTLLRSNNISISKCQRSGVFAWGGATSILEGSETLIYNNCLNGSTSEYGLRVIGSSSKIQIVSPLTKESISKGNLGGGNCGGNGQIETIEE